MIPGLTAPAMAVIPDPGSHRITVILETLPITKNRWQRVDVLPHMRLLSHGYVIKVRNRVRGDFWGYLGGIMGRIEITSPATSPFFVKLLFLIPKLLFLLIDTSSVSSWCY